MFTVSETMPSLRGKSASISSHVTSHHCIKFRSSGSRRTDVAREESCLTFATLCHRSWGSQRPSVHMSLHITAQNFAPLGHAERRSPVKRHVYRERDYAFA